jgi:glycosyltransferase involved in cell wall biosynthesis
MQVSLVIAACNEGEALSKTLASCIETTSGLEGEYEIVLVDDASDDGSVDAVAQRFPQVKIYRHDVRQGASPARAAGASHANGDVLVFLDGHTRPDVGAIERLVADVRQLKVPAIVTPAVPALDVSSWTTDTAQVGNGYGLDLETFDCGWLPLNELTSIVELGSQFFESPALIGCAFAVSRDLYEKLQGFDSGMKSWGMEDLDFGIRCWLMGSRILHDPKASIGHRFRTHFESYPVPVEHLLVNQLRVARKIFSPSVWSDWVERCRKRVSDGFPDCHERFWAHVWHLFTEDLAAVEQQRSYLQGRLEYDAFWFASKFGLSWPCLGKGLSVDQILPRYQEAAGQAVAVKTQEPVRRAKNLPFDERGGRILTAARYHNPGDLCVIVCLFNLEQSKPGQNEDKLRNFNLCRSLFRKSEIPLIVVECAFRDDPWVLDPAAEVMQLRTSTALWQKERLINCGLTRVPDRCTKVAWIDADIVFENPDWAVQASDLLEDFAVVQLADRFVRLPRGCQAHTGVGEIWESFAAVYLKHPNAMLFGDFGVHGHTGFGWAARRSVLEQVGLYDACIAGGGDHVMAHAFCGDWESPCLTRMMGPDSPSYRDAVAWASKVYPLVRARLGVVTGAALHLWHGDISSRRHMLRYEALRNARFDPDRDLETDESGCWRWASHKPSLHAALENYMADRRTEASDTGHSVAIV